jgi:hypothetical protein
MHQGRLAGKGNEIDLCRVAELIFQANVGTNNFQADVEQFLLKHLDEISANLQNFTNLFKASVSYHIKDAQFEQVLFTTLE